MNLGNCGCGCECKKPVQGKLGSADAAFGWSVRIPAISKAGHEVLTMRALGSPPTVRFTAGGGTRRVTLTRPQVRAIIAGNRSVDLGWRGTGVGMLFVLAEKEQKRHALRRNYGQSQAAALRDIIGELTGQHRGIVGETNPGEQLRRIGRALHLVQDAYSPAHIERDPGRWCVRYIRNYGRGRAPREHGKPSDSRDEVAHGPSAAAAARAVRASQEYLAIAFKALWAKRHADAAAAGEATRELSAFVRRHLSAC